MATKRSIERNRARREKRAPVTDRVIEAGLESFPASDPPGWTLGIEPADRAETPAREEERPAQP